MKKTMKNAAIGLFTLLAVTSAITSSATNIENEAELKAAGKINNQPVFQLDLNNSSSSKFMIVIKDEYGVTLYQEVITGMNISRKYQLNTEELGGVDVRFEIIDVKNNKTSVFNIQNNSQVLNKTSIVKN